MELIYKNDYGSTYKIENTFNSPCELQLVVDTIGLFMSRDDLSHLLKIVQKTSEPCTCSDCGGNQCNKIWCTNSLIDICLKVDNETLYKMEDLIKGTQFILNIDDTLEEYRIV